MALSCELRGIQFDSETWLYWSIRHVDWFCWYTLTKTKFKWEYVNIRSMQIRLISAAAARALFFFSGQNRKTINPFVPLLNFYGSFFFYPFSNPFANSSPPAVPASVFFKFFSLLVFCKIKASSLSLYLVLL